MIERFFEVGVCVRIKKLTAAVKALLGRWIGYGTKVWRVKERGNECKKAELGRSGGKARKKRPSGCGMAEAEGHGVGLTVARILRQSEGVRCGQDDGGICCC